MTHRCNLQCDYCYNNSGQPDDNEMSIASALTALTLLIKEYNLSSITLSGGEPLLHSGLQSIVGLLSSNSVSIALITNGTMLTLYPPAFYNQFDTIVISLHENFETNINVEFLSLIKVPYIRYNIVVNNRCLERIPEYLRFAKKTGIRSTYSIQKSSGRGIDNQLLSIDVANQLEKLYPQIFYELFDFNEKTNCCHFSDDYNSYTMYPNGNMALCQVLSYDFVLGSVFGNWLANKKRALLKLSELVVSHKQRDCSLCLLNSICQGGCPADIGSSQLALICQMRCKSYLKRVLGSNNASSGL